MNPLAGLLPQEAEALSVMSDWLSNEQRKKALALRDSIDQSVSTCLRTPPR